MKTVARDQVTGFGWRRLVRAAAVTDFLLLASTAVVLTDIEAGGFALATLVFIALLRFRKGTFALVLLGLLFADVTYWMASGAIDNLRHAEGFLETAVPAALAIASIAGLVGAVGALLRRGDGAARAVAVGAVVVLVGVLVAGAVRMNGGAAARPGEIAIEARDVKFSDTTLEAPSGEIAIAVSNGDLFWHTFTIRELGVNVNLPVGADRRAVFDAAPGSYEFVCKIGPHARLGMRGTLTVR